MQVVRVLPGRHLCMECWLPGKQSRRCVTRVAYYNTHQVGVLSTPLAYIYIHLFTAIHGLCKYVSVDAFIIRNGNTFFCNIYNSFYF